MTEIGLKAHLPSPGYLGWPERLLAHTSVKESECDGFTAQGRWKVGDCQEPF